MDSLRSPLTRALVFRTGRRRSESRGARAAGRAECVGGGAVRGWLGGREPELQNIFEESMPSSKQVLIAKEIRKVYNVLKALRGTLSSKCHVSRKARAMVLAERLLLYVAQRLADEQAPPSRTRLLKIIYLIDVEYYRRNRETLTKWQWKFYHYGPYVMEYPTILQRLDLAGLTETEDRDAKGRHFFKYRVYEDQIIDNVVMPGFLTILNSIIKKWALEDFNVLLNFVYFRTEPMKDAQFGKLLDFGKIRSQHPISSVDWSDVAPPKDLVAQLRNKLADVMNRTAKEKDETAEILKGQPFIADEAYENAMGAMQEREDHTLPDHAAVRYVG